MALVRPDLGDNVPEAMRDTILAIKLFIPDELTDVEQKIYNRGVTGKCMTCGSELAETTMAVFNRAGVIMLYCGGACYSDMQVMGFLQEAHEDIVDKVKFRGGEGDGQAP